MKDVNLTKEYEDTIALAAFLMKKAHEDELPYESTNANKIPDLPKIDATNSITGMLLLKKVPSYGIKINTPDWFMYLIELCSGGNPGFIQLMYKEVLLSINEKVFNNKGIPADYTIKLKDFADCYPKEFPIILKPDIFDKYEKMWDAQKIKPQKNLTPDNRVDTLEYWLEVVAK